MINALSSVLLLTCMREEFLLTLNRQSSQREPSIGLCLCRSLSQRACHIPVAYYDWSSCGAVQV